MSASWWAGKIAAPAPQAPGRPSGLPGRSTAPQAPRQPYPATTPQAPVQQPPAAPADPDGQMAMGEAITLWRGGVGQQGMTHCSQCGKDAVITPQGNAVARCFACGWNPRVPTQTGAM